MPHGNDHRIRRNVHHNDIQQLQTNPQLRHGDDIEATAADSDGLEKAVQNTEVPRDDGYGGIVDIEEFEADPVDGIESENHEEEPEGLCAREEVGVHAAGVAEDEEEGGDMRGFGKEVGEKFENGPDYETED